MDRDLPPIDDPVQDLIDFTKKWARILWLTLLGEDSIIGVGDRMKITKDEPNEIVTSDTPFIERLDSDRPDLDRLVQQYRRHLAEAKERSHKHIVQTSVQLCAVLFANKQFRMPRSR